jgi:single-stranded-DNA-specific exonuclease
MKKTIRTRSLTRVPQALAGLHPMLARIYAARGISSADDIERGLKGLAPVAALRGLEAALVLLETALRQQQRILIVGDFDADGATSSVLSVLVLRALGAAHVDYLVPNRFEYGYGLTPEIVAVALREKTPALIITVDNGIASVEGVAAAQAAGVRVLVTDHHLPGSVLPAADAIVNPNQDGCEFPSKNLAGVGVVFYLLSALRSRLREAGWFAERGLPDVNMAEYLDIVALGTVADVVQLDRNNRILVHQGLARIRAGRCRPGITALLQVGKRSPEKLVATDLGFVVAPRLNAAGRLDDMGHGIECLLTNSPALAQQYAEELDALNMERREIESGMQQQALEALRALQFSERNLPHGICLYDAGWHQGVIGILAGRIKDRTHRPVIAFAEGGAPGELKGSARSIPGVHIRDVLDYVATQNPGLISRFGGHAMAAGLGLPKAHLADFKKAFDTAVQKMSDPADLEAVLLSDGELPPDCMNERFADLLRESGPWGQGFAEPLFHGDFTVVDQRVLKEKHVKLSLRLPGSERMLDAIAFNIDRENWSPGVERVRMAYRLDINEFRGARTLQLRAEYLEIIE